MARQGAWIDVFPFNGRNIQVHDNGRNFLLEGGLEKYSKELWQPKLEKGWKSSWIPFADYVSFEKDKVDLGAGTMGFWQVDGAVKSIEEQKPFAPEQGFVNALSVGFLTATKDGKVIFQRRPENVHCPNILIHEPCGYMASRNFVPNHVSDNLENSHDPRLFDIYVQLEKRREELANTFGVSTQDVNYNLTQDFLASGWLTKEMYFSTTGKINAEQKDLRLPEKEEFIFVPFEDLKQLLYNQSRLAKVNPIGYRPSDSREIPLIDESLIGLVYGYEK